jgi:hypothetical protein
MSTLTSLNAADLTIARGRVFFWVTLPKIREGVTHVVVYNPAIRRVLSSRNVVFDEVVVLSMGESSA